MIYHRDAQEGKLIPVLKIDTDLLIYKVIVVEHNHEKTVFAVQEFKERENVSIYSMDVNRSDEAEPIRHHKFPSDLQLVGSREGLLYFVPEFPHENSFYVAFRENLKAKQRYLGCDNIKLACVFNELFRCVGCVNKKLSLLIIDLSTDTILFRRPLTNLILNYSCFSIIPVLEKYSNLQSFE